jgi:S-adenosylmethionine-diacylgycerolhomoserine-N-methlytransferase
MSFLQELKTLRHIALAPIRGGTHAERLESFYAGQSEGYDAFREKLLHGRQALFANAVAGIDAPKPVWIDIGAGTGRNLEFVGDAVPRFEQIHLVDLSQSLLKVASQRVARHQWSNVQLHAADATTFHIPQKADLITFSYSLSMIPDWFKALENAYAQLKEGGTIASVDFFVSRKYPDSKRASHSWWTRTFWPAWFASDGVHVTSDVLEYLCWKFQNQSLSESLASVPYVPAGRVPYYQFIGKKVELSQ